MLLGLDPDSTVVEISEDDPRWPSVEKYLIRERKIPGTYTEFTREELREAPFVRHVGDWQEQYPEPKSGGYLEGTYDLANYCSYCGVGKRQKAPFRIKKEPNWKSRSFMQLHWVDDELFTRPQVWKTFFQPLGIDSLPVLHHGTGKPLESVVQLLIPQTAPVDTSALEFFEVCKICGAKKFLGPRRGFDPSITPPNGHAFKSDVWWGGGYHAYKTIYFSRELYGRIAEAKLKTFHCVPCAPATSDPFVRSRFRVSPDRVWYTSEESQEFRKSMWRARFARARANEIHHTESDGRNYLMNVIVWLPELETFQRILDLGADVNAVDNRQMSALHLAAQANQTEMVRILSERGANVDAEDFEGNTPLALAAQVKDVDVRLIRELFDRGANPRHKNRSGTTPIHYAELVQNPIVAAAMNAAVPS